jgi:glycosyltransferase involved in cell wall biosynthesis
MSAKPKISVLIASYNTPFKKLKRAIDSVIGQTFQDFEIILIDDGSNNDSEYKLLDFCRLHETRLLYIRQRNCGQSRAINRGVQISLGQYISILDADDEYLPDHLQSCIDHMKAYDLIASKTLTITDKAEDYFVSDRYDKQKFVHVDDCILFATLFGKRKVFKKIKFKDDYGADAAFYDRAKELFKVGKVDLRTYVYYRNNPDSTCEKIKLKFAVDRPNNADYSSKILKSNQFEN